MSNQVKGTLWEATALNHEPFRFWVYKQKTRICNFPLRNDQNTLSLCAECGCVGIYILDIDVHVMLNTSLYSKSLYINLHYVSARCKCNEIYHNVMSCNVLELDGL